MTRRIPLCVFLLASCHLSPHPAPLKESGEGLEADTTQREPKQADPPPEDALQDEDLNRALEEDRELAQRNPTPAIQNLFLETAAGAQDEAKQGGTGFGTVGVNYGGPLPGSPYSQLGYQAGANVTKREGSRFDILLSGGLNARDLELSGLHFGAGALFDYLRPRDDTDLFGARLIGGASIGSRDHVVLRGVIPLNQAREKTDGERFRQRLLARYDVSWAHEFTDTLALEIRGGRLEGRVESGVLGGGLGLALLPNLSTVISSESDFSGQFAVGFVLRYEFSSRRLPTTVTRFRSLGQGDYTPFPLRQFSELILDPRD